MADKEKIIDAILNFFVWGLGYLRQGQTKKGLLWLSTFIITHIGSFLFGWVFFLTTFPGKIMIIGCFLISFNLAREAYLA